MTKAVTQKQPDGTDARGKAWGKLPCPVGAPLCPHLHMFTNLEALWMPSFGFLWRLELPKHDQLDYWPLVIKLNLQHRSPPEVRDGT